MPQAIALALVLAACSDHPASAPGEGAGGAEAGSIVRIDGSSTVYPISEAVAETWQEQHRGARITIGVSGTGGGMKKFCAGEIEIADASRPIRPVERERCAANGIEFIELPVAFDGIAVVANPAADWLDHVTVEQLRKMWAPEAQGTITRWNQVDPSWPDRPLHLFGPGVDSGTYDYFTEAIVGEEHSSRGDFTSSEDDNVLVQGIATDPEALGFFGLAYYTENAERLKLLGVDDGNADNGDGPVKPSVETVANGTYQPLSRPLFVYVAKAAADRPDVEGFVDILLSDDGAKLVEEVGYVALPAELRAKVRERLRARRTGSMFEDGAQVGVSLADLLARE